MTGSLSPDLRARIALDKVRFQTVHSLGQNFLMDGKLLSELLDEIKLKSDDCVLEIGPGAGVMTALVAERVSRVCAVEIDENLRPVLTDVLSPCRNVEVRFADFMKLNVKQLVDEAFGDRPYRVIANIPYYITADILQRLTTLERLPEKISLMLQKEVALRLMSEPGDREWCALAATVRAYGTTHELREVPPEDFHPSPQVMSSFIEICREIPPVAEGEEMRQLRRMIRTAFQMRRKTLVNNIKSGYGIDREQAQEILKAAGIRENVRGEDLTLEQLLDVARRLNG